MASIRFPDYSVEKGDYTLNGGELVFYTLPISNINPREISILAVDVDAGRIAEVHKKFCEWESTKFDPLVEYVRNKVLEDAKFPPIIANLFHDRNGVRGQVRMMCERISRAISFAKDEFGVNIGAPCTEIQKHLTETYNSILETLYTSRNETDRVEIHDIANTISNLFRTIIEEFCKHFRTMRNLKVPGDIDTFLRDSLWLSVTRHKYIIYHYLDTKFGISMRDIQTTMEWSKALTEMGKLAVESDPQVTAIITAVANTCNQ